MDIYKITYYCFLLFSLILSIIVEKNEKGMRVFPFLLVFSLSSEMLAKILSFYKISTAIIYHVYIPVEYAFWIYYFYQINEKIVIKKILLYSVPVYVVLCLFISFSLVKHNEFPNIQLNVEGILLIIIATYTIFTIEINKNKSIFSRPVFWICVAVLIYYSSIASYIAVYNFILKTKDHLQDKLQLYFLIIPNYILYTCLSIAFICSQKMKKY